MSNFSDGSIPYGTRKCDIYPQTAPAANGGPSTYAGAVKRGTFTCESFEVTRPSYSVRQYDEKRNPKGAYACDDFNTGSCVVQIFDITKQVQRYDGFNVLLDSEIGQEGFWVTSVGKPESQGEYWKQSIQFQQLVSVAAPTATA